MKKRVLVIAAHPDDEALGCGGTMLRHTQEGDSVYVLILGEGVTSRRLHRDPFKDAKVVTALRGVAEKACACLGVKKVFFHNFPDNRFDSVDLIDVVKVIEGVKDKVRPDIVYTHYEKDINIDHQRTFHATMVAFRPHVKNAPSKIYAYEVPSSTESAPFLSQFAPNTFIDISKQLKRRNMALGYYSGEMRPYPHPRSIKAIVQNNVLWGIKSGLKAAEAFLLIRNRVF